MTSIPFSDPERLNKCASSNLVLSLLAQDSFDNQNVTAEITHDLETPTVVVVVSKEDGAGMPKDQSCVELWKAYNLHYGSHEISQNSGEDARSFERSTLWANDDGGGTFGYKLRPRVERFLRSVAFVYKHNSDPTTSHKVALNRFSAVDTRRLFSEYEPPASQNRRHILEVFDPNLAIGHGAKNVLHKHHSKHHSSVQEVPVKELRIPDEDRKPFETPVISSQLDGFLLSIKKTHHLAETSDETVDAVSSSDNYEKYLNWATADNPDGVPIVHDAFDQLSCGSCWAFAAAGSLEASASRRAAFIAFETYRTSHRERWQVNMSVQEEAVAIAQNVQRRAMQVLNLSVQELLDCDSITDQGCVGGNPLLAFYYIHQNGLVSWEDYPYEATAGTCKKNSTDVPVATVKAWGIIQSDHEKHMELALRYIGPIAVGINGDNPEFLAYSGGIFDSPTCKQTADHALLVVGYGEEENSNGESVKYWIARNSWGTGWGEHGYVRIKRGLGHYGMKGVCGIARNPSVALGGVLLRDTAYVFNEPGLEPAKTFDPQNLCSHLGFNMSFDNSCTSVGTWVESHKAFTLGIIGVFCGLVLLWPLSMDIRRRRELRRRQKAKREEKRRNSSKLLMPTEDTPLLSSTTTGG